MLKSIRLALVFTVLITGIMLVLGGLTIAPSKSVAKTPYLSSLSDGAIGTALACPPNCTQTQTGPRHLQCFSTTNCTNCVWNEEAYVTQPCGGS